MVRCRFPSETKVLTAQVLIQRVSYGALALTLLIALFAVDAEVGKRLSGIDGMLAALFQRGSVVPLLTSLVFLQGARELNHFYVLRGVKPYAGYAYVMVVAVFFTPWLSAAGWLGDGVAQLEGAQTMLVVMLIAIGGAWATAVLKRDTTDCLRNSSATLQIIFYLGFLSSFGLQIRCGRDIPVEAGAWLMLYILLITKASDIGAFFAGSILGRHKLWPGVSPGKTIEGTIGGILASAGVATWLLYGATILVQRQLADPGQTFQVDTGIRSMARFLSQTTHLSPMLAAGLLGVVLSIAGQMGDLVESCFKRDACVKDSGQLIPRFGGILDLLDSPLVAMPVAWIVLTVVWPML